MSSEPQVIRWTIHAALGHGAPPPAAEAWAEALEELAVNRLLPLAGRLLGSARSTLPLSSRLAFQAAEAAAARITAQTAAQLAELGPALDDRGFDWLVLKGLPLADRLYPSPSCRPGRDVDLLVAEAELARADGLLQDLGYTRPGRFDRSLHHERYERRRSDSPADLVELHWQALPPGLGGPGTPGVLAGRRRFQGPGYSVWIPSPEVERDILLRHCLKHANFEALLVLDLLLHTRGERYTHPLGQLFGDEQERLGLPRTIGGPRSLRLIPFRRWLGSRRFAERRRDRFMGRVERPLALLRWEGMWAWLWHREIWPEQPSSRWQAVASTRWGRYTWRVRRWLSWATPGGRSPNTP